MSEARRPDPPSAFLVGRRVCLRPMEPDDLAVVMHIANDPELRALTGGVRPMSRACAEEWLSEIRRDAKRRWFAITLRDDNRVIGEAGLLRIFHEWRGADMTVIIAEKALWGKGLGTEAANLLIEHAFGAMSLHRLAVGVVAANARAIRFWQSLGFQREGILRDGYFCEGRFQDFIMMSLLSTDQRPGKRALEAT